MAPIVTDVTIRQVAHLSIAGDSIRLRLSNLFGTSAVTLDTIHVARSTGGFTIDTTTDHAVTFANSTTATIPAGGTIVSDAVSMPVAALSDIAVSVHVAAATSLTTGHYTITNAYAIGGNSVAANPSSATALAANSYWLDEIDASSALAANVVVAFGDSITDGSQSTPGAHASYPEQLAARVATQSNPRIAVLNAGIGGNRWLQDVRGPSGSSRFARDVLGTQAVTHTIILLGINDFIVVRAFGGAPVTAGELMPAIQSAIAQAKAAHVKVLLGTLTPYKGSMDYNADDDTQRVALNTWIRQNTDADGTVDFDAALRDPADALSLAANYASPDHLHPNDAGYAAMANLVDLAKLR